MERQHTAATSQIQPDMCFVNEVLLVALAGVALWLEHPPVTKRLQRSSPRLGTGACDPELERSPIPSVGACGGNWLMLLLHQCFSLSLPLQKKNNNENVLRWKQKIIIIKIKYYWNTDTLMCSHIARGCFPSTVARCGPESLKHWLSGRIFTTLQVREKFVVTGRTYSWPCKYRMTAVQVWKFMCVTEKLFLLLVVSLPQSWDVPLSLQQFSNSSQRSPSPSLHFASPRLSLPLFNAHLSQTHLSIIHPMYLTMLWIAVFL